MAVTCVVLEDQFDLAARHRGPILLDVEIGRSRDLLAGRGEGPGHWQDEADLDALLRLCCRSHKCGEGCGGERLQKISAHGVSS
jgi:hypothetical protein